MQRETIQLHGAAQLEAVLAAMGSAIATEVGRKAVIASAEVLKEAWVQGAPYDPEQRSSASKTYGHLRANITIGPVRNQNVHAVVYKVSTGDAFWGYFVEYGTAKMPAQPWARPIVEAKKARLINVQVDILREGIEDVARGLYGDPAENPILSNSGDDV